jgi:hypothetical protein
VCQRCGKLATAAADVGRAGEDFDGGIGGDGLAGLGRFLAAHQDFPRHDEGLGLFAGFNEPARNQQTVETQLHAPVNLIA